MYEQTLYKILHNHVKPKILKRMNRYKKWEYGYNAEYDTVIISKTGKIGEIYEISGIMIAFILAGTAACGLIISDSRFVVIWSEAV